jgi:hypothetical protein
MDLSPFQPDLSYRPSPPTHGMSEQNVARNKYDPIYLIPFTISEIHVRFLLDEGMVYHYHKQDVKAFVRVSVFYKISAQ